MAASYPSSAKSFTTKNAAQIIDASHVNDLQDEVTAIETYLITGPTFPSLVTTGVVTVGTIATAAAQPRAVVFNSAAQSVANATRTVLTFDSEVLDVGGLHSTSSNTGRLTIPAGGDGIYFVSAIVPFTANATGQRQATIRKNGADLNPYEINAPSAAAFTTLTLDMILQLVAGDYVECTAYQDSTVSLDLGNGTTSRVQFQAIKVW